jgi:nitroreductase
VQRRSFLKGMGVASVLVVGGAVWRAHSRGVFSVGEGPAFEPWRDWRDATSGPLALVQAAILAANSHNTQPWLFKIGDSSIELHADTERNAGALDPYLREQHIGLGCALENLMLAAAAQGYAATATLFAGKLSSIAATPKLPLVARVDWTPGLKHANELYDAIPHRHTNRNPYYLKALPADFIESIHQLTNDESDIKLFLFNTEADRARIVDMIVKANHVVYADPQVELGSDPWIRTNWSDIQTFRDGIIVDEFGDPPLTTASGKFLPQSLKKFASRHGLLESPSYADILKATPLFGLIALRDRYDKEQNLRAGRIWQRAHLFATARGIAGRPVNEAVELIDNQRLHNQPPQAEAALAELTGDNSWKPTFMFRFGYPIRDVSPSPRRPVKDALI